jgi:hypothetical protein
MSVSLLVRLLHQGVGSHPRFRSILDERVRKSIFVLSDSSFGFPDW